MSEQRNNEMCDLFFVVQLHIDDVETINVLCVIPSTWVVLKDRKQFAIYPLPPYSQQAMDQLSAMVQKREDPPGHWPKHLFSLKKKAHSFHEALMYVKILSSGTQNASNEDRITNLMNVEDYRPAAPMHSTSSDVLQSEQVQQNKRPRSSDEQVPVESMQESLGDSDTESRVLRRSNAGLGDPNDVMRNPSNVTEPNFLPEGQSSMMLASVKDVTDLKHFVGAQFKSLEDEMNKIFVEIKDTLERSLMTNLFNKLTAMHLEVLQTNALIISTKNVGEKENIKTLHEILSTYKIKKTLDESDSSNEATPIFSDVELFDKFEAHELFMLNDNFKKDLKNYFLTSINVAKTVKNEGRNILKAFFKGSMLHENFTGIQKQRGKRSFADTKFGSLLISALVAKFQSTVPLMETNDKQREESKTITEKSVAVMIGEVITRADDWDKLPGSKRRTTSSHNKSADRT